MTDPRLIDADDVCVAVETTLRERLPEVILAKGRHVRQGRELPYTPPKIWDQVPTLEALDSIPAFPHVVGGITSPGLAGPPVRKTFNTYDATWRIAVGIFGRGRDYNETARRARRWAAMVRAALVLNPSLGIGAASLAWVGEEYRQVAQKERARILAGIAVAVDVQINNVVDFTTGPTVAADARPSVTVS